MTQASRGSQALGTIVFYSILCVLFFNQPVQHAIGGTLVLKVELHIVQCIAYLLETGFRIEVGIASGEEFADVA